MFITTESHHVGETFMFDPLLFPWPCSGFPTFLILESPLLRSRSHTHDNLELRSWSHVHEKKELQSRSYIIFATAPQPCRWKQDANGISFLYFLHKISSFFTFVLSFRN